MKRSTVTPKPGFWRILLVLFLLLLPALPAASAAVVTEPGIAPGWMAVHADAQNSFNNMSQHSLKLSPVSPNYYPQVAFGGDHLYYAYKDGTGWHTQVVDSAWAVGGGAALALDSGGKAHISYYDATNKNLKYATNKGGSWVTSTVVNTGDVGLYSDIAIDQWGDPAIVYFNAGSHKLDYIYYDSEYGGWGNIETVASANDPYHSGWFSFAFDTSIIPNKPHVSYYLRTSNTHGTLQWAHYNTSNAWTHEQVDSCVDPSPLVECRIGEYNSLALDPTNSNRPAIAYALYDIGGMQTLMYRYYNGSYWTADVTAPGTLPTDISMAFDSIGVAHVSWMENGFNYSRRTAPDAWSALVKLDASTTAGGGSSLTLVGTTAKVVYYDSIDGSFKFKDQNRSTWYSPETFALQGHQVGTCSSIKVDSLGRAHISYYDSTGKALLYLRYNPDGSKSFATPVSSANLSCFSVLAVNPTTNAASIAYIVAGTLYYSLGANSWTSPMVIDTGVNTGYDYQSFGMALAPDGTPHFAYRKGTDLYYTYWTGSAWSHNLIASGVEGAYVALALGPDNRPHIAYYLWGSPGELKHTHYTGSAWSTTTIAARGIDQSGTGIALVVDPTGKPQAAYMDLSGQHLRISSGLCAPVCSWGAGVLLDDASEEYFSLSLSPDGTPHLAAYAWTGSSYELHYVTYQGGAWTVLRMDTNYDVGWQPSIALAKDGSAYISYEDGGNRDLKLVFHLRHLFLPQVKK
jgi:hypothetical protein